MKEVSQKRGVRWRSGRLRYRKEENDVQKMLPQSAQRSGDYDNGDVRISLLERSNDEANFRNYQPTKNFIFRSPGKWKNCQGL